MSCATWLERASIIICHIDEVSTHLKNSKKKIEKKKERKRKESGGKPLDQHRIAHHISHLSAH